MLTKVWSIITQLIYKEPRINAGIVYEGPEVQYQVTNRTYDVVLINKYATVDYMTHFGEGMIKFNDGLFYLLEFTYSHPRWRALEPGNWVVKLNRSNFIVMNTLQFSILMEQYVCVD